MYNSLESFSPIQINIININPIQTILLKLGLTKTTILIILLFL